MWRPPGKLRRIYLLIKHRLLGRVTIWQDIELRHSLMRSSFRGERIDPTRIGFYWKTWAYVRFWRSPLDIEIKTNTGVLNQSELNAIYAALNRDILSAKSRASDQVAQWMGTKEKKNLVGPTLELDLRESCVPGHFKLVYQISGVSTVYKSGLGLLCQISMGRLSMRKNKLAHKLRYTNAISGKQLDSDEQRVAVEALVQPHWLVLSQLLGLAEPNRSIFHQARET